MVSGRDVHIQVVYSPKRRVSAMERVEQKEIQPVHGLRDHCHFLIKLLSPYTVSHEGNTSFI